MPSSIPPEDLVGLLADGDRLRVFAALVLGHERYADTAALRRYLVDDGFLEREGGGGHYWRSGGTFEIDGLASA